VLTAMADALLRTPLYEWHKAKGGRMVDFSGWQMPVSYESIVEEHLATRRAATLFDISHMARFRFDGPEASALLDRLCTRRVVDLKPGHVRYSLITRDDGGILDDVLVYRLSDERGQFHWLVANAGNRDKIRAWIEARLPGESEVRFTDQTLDTAMIALQGPLAERVLGQQFPTADSGPLGYYQGHVRHIDGCSAVISRTGYTGEDGFELTVPSDMAAAIWSQLLGSSVGPIRAAGLGARDTLRLEAGMPLYGHELTEAIHPYQAGLGFAVNLKNRQFTGRDALEAIQRRGGYPRLVGLRLEGKRVAREGYTVHAEGRAVGAVTSGTFSPTLQAPIAMAYIEAQCAEGHCRLSVDLRGKSVPVRLTEIPFYRRS
jgi:aminomethyltransferase